MTNLVCNNIRLGEITRRAEALLQLGEEAEVDVNILVVRAVERTRRRAGGSAAGIDAVCEKCERRLWIILAHFLEDFSPGVLVISQYRSDEGALIHTCLRDLATAWGRARGTRFLTEGRAG